MDPNEIVNVQIGGGGGAVLNQAFDLKKMQKEADAVIKAEAERIKSEKRKAAILRKQDDARAAAARRGGRSG